MIRLAKPLLPFQVDENQSVEILQTSAKSYEVKLEALIYPLYLPDEATLQVFLENELKQV